MSYFRAANRNNNGEQQCEAAVALLLTGFPHPAGLMPLPGGLPPLPNLPNLNLPLPDLSAVTLPGQPVGAAGNAYRLFLQ